MKKDKDRAQPTDEPLLTKVVASCISPLSPSHDPVLARMLESYFKFKVLDSVCEAGHTLQLAVFGKPVRFSVLQCSPVRGKVGKKTTVVLQPMEGEQTAPEPEVQCFGMDGEKGAIRMCVSRFREQKDLLLRAGQVAIQGRRGSGKRTLFKSLRTEFSLHLVNGKQLGSLSKQQLGRQLFELRNKLEPDTLLVVQQAQSLKRALELPFLIFYLTRVPLDFRVDKTISVGLPDPEARAALLAGFVRRAGGQLSEQQLKQLSSKTIGFAGADLIDIVREAHYSGSLTKASILRTIKANKPASLAKVIVQVPQVAWSDIGGYADAKKKIARALETPLKRPDLYQKYGIAPIKGILLYGPPGCSKTLMARAIASASSYFFLAVKGPELFSKYVGDSEKTVRQIFARARACSPCVIFIDEIDAIASQRNQQTEVSDRVLLMLLNEMDGISELKDVVVVGATNRPDTLDRAILRPGRLDHLIYIGLPDAAAREDIFRINLSKMPLQVGQTQEWSKSLGARTQGLSGAQICHVVKLGVMQFIEEGCERITLAHFEVSLSRVKPRVNGKMIQRLQEFSASWGQ